MQLSLLYSSILIWHCNMGTCLVCTLNDCMLPALPLDGGQWYRGGHSLCTHNGKLYCQPAAPSHCCALPPPANPAERHMEINSASHYSRLRQAHTNHFPPCHTYVLLQLFSQKHVPTNITCAHMVKPR